MRDKLPSMCIELVPGANTYVVPEEEPDPQPPEWFVDTNTYWKRRNPETGKEEIYKITDIKGNILWQKGEGEDMPIKPRDNREEKMPVIKRLRAEGKTLKEISRELDVPYATLYMWLRIEEEGKTGNSKVHPNKEELIPKILKMREEGKTGAEIAKELNIPEGTIWYWLYVEKNKKQQAQESEPAEAANQEPEQEEEEKEDYSEPAEESIAEEIPPVQLAQEHILARAKVHVQKVIEDPVALALLKELLRQEVI